MSGSEDCVRFSYKLTTEREILQQKLKGASQRKSQGSLCLYRGQKRKKKKERRCNVATVLLRENEKSFKLGEKELGQRYLLNIKVYSII